MIPGWQRISNRRFSPEAAPRKAKVTDIVILAFMTLGGLLVHGYHLGLEDEAVYLPAIKHYLDPALYPHDSIFFLEQMKFTLYDKLMAMFIRLSHLRVDIFVFLAHVISVYLILLGCLALSRRLFTRPGAQWASVGLIAALFTLPITGTALLLVDQYLHPRNFAVAFILFSLVNTLDRRFIRAGTWLAAAMIVSPLMSIPGALFSLFLAVKPSMPKRARRPLGALLAAGVVSQADVPGWNEVTRSYFYLSRWHWYEILGVIAPLVILYAFALFRPANTLPSYNFVSRRTCLFGSLFAMLSLALCAPPLEKFLALQPMRSFHLVYLIMILYSGGLVGEMILKNKPLRWALFFLPLCITMFSVQRYQFEASNHIEWPGMRPRNEWVQAFQWISRNTPKDAFFALDPYYMECEGADFHGFRAIAERSTMPDQVKDPAVMSVLTTATTITSDNFINMSEVSRKWSEQMGALRGWKNFGPDDFHRLKERFGVGWVVLEKPDKSGLPCVYENDAVKVCRVE